MIARQCALPKHKSFFLFGPRQTGKTSLIEATFTKNVWTVDLLLNQFFLPYSKDPARFAREAIHQIEKKGVKTIVIDEVQKIPALLDEVQSLMRTHDIRFILTGSSARKLKKGGANLLAGRAVQRYLHPLTYAEIADEFDLERTLRLGSLPAIYGKSEEEAIDVIKTYAETYLREEIQSEGIVRNLGGFSRFLDIAAAESGEILNYSNVGREAQVNTKSIQSFYEILEDTLIGITLNPWMKSVRKRLSVHPKFYFFDTGVVNGVNRRLTASVDPVLRGRLFEQWLVLESHRMISYRMSEARLFYWRTNIGTEVDLIVEKHGKIVGAFEFKSSRSVGGHDFNGLKSFRDDMIEHKRVPLYLVACIERAYEKDDMTVIPWQEFLETILPKII